MRRGLIAWSPAELPDAVLCRARRPHAERDGRGGARRARPLQQQHAPGRRRRGFAASCPIGRKARWCCRASATPISSWRLTKRVATWIAATSKVATVISTPRFGRRGRQDDRATRAAAQSASPISTLLPAGIADGLARRGRRRCVDATALFARLRGVADPAELALAAHARRRSRTARWRGPRARARRRARA